MVVLTTKCPHCGARYKVDEVYRGQEVMCQACTQSFIVRPEVQETHAYCRTCGNSVGKNTRICLSCGCDPSSGELFCPSCGANVRVGQIICVACGTDLRRARFRLISQIVSRLQPSGIMSAVVIMSNVIAMVSWIILFISLVYAPVCMYDPHVICVLVTLLAALVLMAYFTSLRKNWARVCLTILLMCCALVGVIFTTEHVYCLLPNSLLSICSIVLVWLRPVNLWMRQRN